MTYSYEHLSPQRFQQLCQALLLETFPHAQCLPVGQADGGRDALQSTRAHDGSKPTIVFQVKFNTKAPSEKRPHSWLRAQLEEERKVIEQLAKKGMEQYILLTNVAGTAAADKGSIDIVQRILDETIPVPAQCWWRDDIDRRLERSSTVRWNYPEILTGLDVISAILTSRLSDDKDRRDNAIRAYITTQFHLDEEVRFKQIELQNKLFDLFIDVPIVLDQLASPFDALSNGTDPTLPYDGELDFQYDEDKLVEALLTQRRSAISAQLRRYGPAIGAASLLLRPIVQRRVRRLVLEGAPGQGKSTIAQYLCQVHRIRLLNKAAEFKKVPPHHLSSPVRLPMKVDLRDFAVWMEGRDPFSSHAERPQNWRPSLEAFLAGQISHFTGGAQFSVSDLHAVARVSHLLVVLDGFDEVAEVESRRHVVDAIVKAAERLEELAASFQMVVTSRPAAFANSPGFPIKTFPHLELGAVTREQAVRYATKWAVARALTEQEQSEFIATLKSKLDEPHLRELARNPMQLAILLSLILSRGASLPDKRTAMYYSYIEVFLGREAEKSSVVREHRELLINVHGYLAWLLHTEAEESSSRGSIAQDRLQSVLVKHLNYEGQDITFVEQFFTGMVERVGALVSRVQGTFEFEVQPLREYFAARHLYETAPHSPTGRERSGTKPERFEVIVRNFYWLNVTRFYAGCFSRGELEALVDCLQELMEADSYRYISYPLRLCKMLLGDWVFSQQPKVVAEVVRLMTDRSGLRILMASEDMHHGAREFLQLPEKCGRRVLLERCFEELKETTQRDYMSSLCRVIDANAAEGEAKECWLGEWVRRSSDAGTHWLRCGRVLQIFADPGLFEMIWSEVAPNLSAARQIIIGGGDIHCEKNRNKFEIAYQIVLDNESSHFAWRLGAEEVGVLSLVAMYLNPQFYSMLLRGFPQIGRISLEDVAQAHFGRGLGAVPVLERIKDLGSPGDHCRELLECVREQFQRSCDEWLTRLEPWSEIVEVARLGGRAGWLSFCFANAAVGVVGRAGHGAARPDLFDESAPLCSRIHTARRSRSVRWWRECLSGRDESQEKTVLAVTLSWAPPIVLGELQGTLDERLENLEERDWQQVLSAARLANGTRRSSPAGFRAEWLSREAGPRLAVAYASRAVQAEAQKIYGSHLVGYGGDDRTIAAFCQMCAISEAHKNPEAWQQALRVVRRSYANGAASSPVGFYAKTRVTSEESLLPAEVAAQVCAAPHQYPLFMIRAAEARRAAEVRTQVRPVGQVAREKGWFPEA